MYPENLMLFILFSVFWLIGFILLLYIMFRISQSLKIKLWKIAPGVLTYCSLDTISNENGPVYQAKVEYVYTVDGIQYTGNRLAFGYCASNIIEPHNEIVQKLDNIKSVGVRYHPGNPQVSTLSHGFVNSLKLMLYISLVILAFASCSMISLFIDQKNAIMSFALLIFFLGGFFSWRLFSKTDDILLKNIVIG